MKLGMNDLWPTKVMYQKVDAVRMAEMCHEILTCFNLTTPQADETSNLGSVNIFEHGSDVIRRFKDEIVLPDFDAYMKQTVGFGLEKYKHSFVKGWLTYNSTSSVVSIPHHNHSNAQFCSVYYVLADADGGELVFSDPRGNACRGFGNELKDQFMPEVMMPETNDSVVFPGFLYHHVNPYTSRFRIALAVDLFLRSSE